MGSELRGAELVFGLVAPLGTPLDPIESALRESLASHGYETAPTIRISALLAQDVELSERPEVRRQRLMEVGNQLRASRGGDHLAKLAIAAAHAWRRGNANPGPAVKTAQVIRALKHPDEVALLRAVYGNGFFLIGSSAPRSERRQRLIDQNFPQSEAERLLDKDSGERLNFGQQTRETFQHADVYLRVGPSAAAELARFVDLVMSHPFLSPTAEEFAMYLAYAASLRSSDLSRQVGAVVVNDQGDVIATGANDVPSAGGGPYWPTRPDGPAKPAAAGPDHARGFDSNERERNRIIGGIIRALTDDGGSDDHELVAKYREALEPTGVLDLTEFGRAVHAEMAALLACARAGARPKGGTLYCTTFPCHNCTKHIVEAGLKRVVYVEPYPKSKARDLHDDAIAIVDEEVLPLESHDTRVKFETFVGVGARRFVDLFSMTLGSGRPVRRKQRGGDGARVAWERGRDSAPRLALDPRSYLEHETAVAGTLLDSDQGDGKVGNGEGGRSSPQEVAT